MFDDPFHFDSAKMLRSVSFVERLELEFSGSHFSQALALGDVDGDEVGSFACLEAKLLTLDAL